MNAVHYPVMYKEIVEHLDLKNKKVVVDCTVGVASHAIKFLEQMSKDSFLIGIDKDEESLRMAGVSLKDYTGQFKLFKEDFRNIDRVLDLLGMQEADVFFFDLGISTYQLSDSQRGFSFLREGPLDMRMDRHSFFCAYDLINHLSESELSKIFKKFGEEKFSKRIAHSVVERRRQSPITTTTQLSGLVLDAVGQRVAHVKVHPATRIFQALRIAVNRELDSLEIGIRKAVQRTAPGGKIAVISFHSLEDRIVKHTFREYAHAGVLKIVTKKPLMPSGQEVKDNNASRSAKLRVVEKL